MSEIEVATAVEVAHEWNKRVACHARAAASVKRAVRNGVDCIYHCDFADEEALDMLEAAKDRVIVGPAFGLVHNAVFEGDAVGMTARRRRDDGPAAQARGDLPHLSSRCASAA